MIRVHTLILGGGLTGLSTAYHLQQAGHSDYLLVEQTSQPGGLCRSFYKDGFTFDCSGHLLHLHTAYGKKWVRALLPNNLRRVKRNAWVYTHDTYIPFPFQANLYALPEKQRRECADGLKDRPVYATPSTFKEWCLTSFGKGIYKHFFRPYNTKLWGLPPSRLTCDWCGPFIPRPSGPQLQQMLSKKSTRPWGYNTYFYYPVHGGCGALVEALAKRVLNLRLNTRVTSIDLTTKTARIGTQTVRFDYLVNTLALPQFLQLLKNTPALSRLASRLKPVSVLVYHLAVRGKGKKFSWIYFPDSKDPFFRVGQQSSFSPYNAPKGCRSFYVELPGIYAPSRKLEKQIWNSLLQKGIITRYDEKITAFWQKIPAAYALFDKKHTATVQKALCQLEELDCLCAGRYGRWEYSFMETSILQGRETAQKLL